MRKSILFAASLLIFAVASCNKDVQGDEQAPVEAKPQVTLSFNAALTPPTKTEIGSSETSDGVTVHQIHWSKGDKIAVYPHNPSSTAGVDGVEFTSEDLAEASAAEAVFTGEIDAADTYYAFYPTTAGAKWHGGSYSDFSVTLPSEQVANGIASGFAVANVSGTEKVTFDHVCGFVKFTIDDTYAGKIKEVRFSGKNSEALAGKLFVYPDDMSENKINSSKQTVLTLTPSAGEAFAAGTYYFTCFPVNLTGGLELTFVDTDDKEAVKSSANPANIERAGVLNLGTVANLQFETVAPPIADGNYAIMVKVGDSYKAMSSVPSGTRLAAVDAIYDGESSTVSISDATAIWTLANTTKNIYTIANDSKYLTHSGSNNSATTSDSEKTCTIINNEDGTYRIELESDELRYFAYNSSNNYFGFYGTNTTSNYTLYVVPAVLVAKLDTPVIEVSVDDKTVTVTWTDVENATSYEVACGEEALTIDAGVQTCAFTMDDYGTYEVTVTANADGYVSATSEVVTCTLLSEDSKYYVKVTNNLEDWSGRYLIVYENNASSVAFNGSLSSLDAVSNTIDVSISDRGIASTSTSDKSSFVIEKVDGGYTIQSSSGYYIGQISDANGLASNTTTTYVNTITCSESGVDVVSGGAYLRYNSASNQLRFRYYKSLTYTGQKAIQLYKLEE